MQSLSTLLELVRRDDRYPYEAYVFVFEALGYTQKKLGRGIATDDDPESATRHVSGSELSEGMCELARRDFGMMAPVVFRLWNIRRTDDIGELVFNLIDANLLKRTDSDRREDFHDLFDLDEFMRQTYPINLDNIVWPGRTTG